MNLDASPVVGTVERISVEAGKAAEEMEFDPKAVWVCLLLGDPQNG